MRGKILIWIQSAASGYYHSRWLPLRSCVHIQLPFRHPDDDRLTHKAVFFFYSCWHDLSRSRMLWVVLTFVRCPILLTMIMMVFWSPLQLSVNSLSPSSYIPFLDFILVPDGADRHPPEYQMQKKMNWRTLLKISDSFTNWEIYRDHLS